MVINLADISEKKLVVVDDDVSSLRRLKVMFSKYMYEGLDMQNVELVINHIENVKQENRLTIEQILEYIENTDKCMNIDYEKGMFLNNMCRECFILEHDTKYTADIKKLAHSIYPYYKCEKETIKGLLKRNIRRSS